MKTESMSTELAVVKRKAVARVDGLSKKANAKDRNRFLLHRRGYTAEEIAARENVKETVVKASIERYQLHRDSLSMEEMDAGLNAMTQRLLPKVEKVIGDAMKAEMVVTTYRGKKELLKRVPDHAMRIKAVDTAKSLIEVTRPKGGGVVVNTQINNPGDTANPARGYSFEERIRKAREAKGLTNDEGIAEAEYEDNEPSSAADELAEIGIDIDDDDDEEDDDEDSEEE